MAPRSNYSAILESIDRGRNALMRSRLSRGVTRFVATVLALAALVVAWGLIREFGGLYSVPAAAGVSLAALVLALAALIKWVVWPLITLPDRNAFVTLVERRYPEAKNQLVNAYQLGREDSLRKHAGSRDVIDAVVAGAGETLNQYDLKTWSSPRDDRGYIALGLGSLLALAVLAWALTAPFQNAVAQALNPSLAAPPPVTLTVFPGDVSVDRGADLQVGVSVEGTGKAPTLKFREPGGEWRMAGFQAEGRVDRDGGRWLADLERIERNLEYAVAAPRAESGVYQVMVNDPPRLQGFRVNIQPPAYTRLPTETLESGSGDLAALKGSRVDLRVLTNVQVPGGHLEWREDAAEVPKTVPLTALDPTQWSAEVPVLEPASYTVVLTDESGRELLRSPRYRVDPLLDRAPYMTLHLPQDDHDLYDDMMERVVADAADDYGFSAAEIVYRIDDGPERTQVLNPFAPGQTEFRLDTLWDLSGLNMLPGQVVSFYVRIVDNDVVTGPKAAVSDVRRVRFPTVAEMYEEVADEHSQEIDNLSEMQASQEEMQERLEKLTEDIKRGQDKDWETEQEVKATLDRQEELEHQLSEVVERLNETKEKAQSRADMSQSLVQKMSQLNELLDNLSNDDLKRSFERLSNALGKQSTDELRRAMEDFQTQQEQMLAGLDRTIELLKQIRKEEQVDDVVRRTDEIARLQEEIAKAMEELGGVPPELAEPQPEAGNPADNEDVPEELQELQDQIAQVEDELAQEMKKSLAEKRDGSQGDREPAEADAAKGEKDSRKPEGDADSNKGEKGKSEGKQAGQEGEKQGDKAKNEGDQAQGGDKAESGQSPEGEPTAEEQARTEQLKQQLEELKQALEEARAAMEAEKQNQMAQNQSQGQEQQSGEQEGEQQQGEQQQGQQQSGQQQQGQQQSGQQQQGEQQDQQQDGEQQDGQEQASPQEQQRMQDLAQQQEDLQRKLDELKRRLEQLKKMNQEEDPALAQDLEEMEQGQTSQELSESMSQSQQSMSQGQKQESTFYAFKAKDEAQRLAQMAEAAQENMQQGLQDNTVAKMERIIQGLIDISRVEERLIKDPHEDEREQARHQYDLVEQARAVSDSLSELAQQSFTIEDPDQRELDDTIARMERATRLYEMGNRRAGNHESRESASDLNQTIVKLMKGHQQMCGGTGSSGGNMQQLMEQMQGLSQAQEMLNQQSGRAQSGGERLSQTERRRLDWLAAQQEMIRQGLQEVQSEFQESEELLGDMESLAQEMENVEQELRGHNLDRRVLERQQRILSRLLDAQRSVRQQEMSPKRESRSGTLARRDSPPPIPDELVQRQRALEEDVLRGAQDRYPSQYRKLVEDYFKALTEQTRTP